MERTLTYESSPLELTWDVGNSVFIMTPGSESDWTVTSGNNAVWFNESTIDLSGYVLQKKSFFPYSSFEQRGSALTATFAAALTEQPYISEIMLVTSVPLDERELIDAFQCHTGFLPTYGMNQGQQNRTTILHGDYKVWTVDSTVSVLGQSAVLRDVTRNIFSSLEPTAADTLFCYRVVYVGVARDESSIISIPPARVLIPGSITKEPKTEYMMRLKRSYELANQV